MASPKRPPQQLLARIDAALPAAKRSDVMTAQPMADLLGMSWRNLLDTYIKPDPEFPILKRGSQGRDYQFPVRKVLMHLRKRMQRLIAEENAKAAEMARLTRVELPSPEEGGPRSYQEVRDAIGAHRSIQQLKAEQGQYVPAAQVRQTIDTIFSSVTRTLLDAGPMLDPIGQMDPSLRQKLDGVLADLIAKVGHDCEAALKDINGSNSAERGGDAGRPRRTGD